MQQMQYNIQQMCQIIGQLLLVELFKNKLTSLQQADGGWGDLQNVLLTTQIGHTEGTCGGGEPAVVQLIDLLTGLQDLNNRSGQ